MVLVPSSLYLKKIIKFDVLDLVSHILGQER